MRLQKVGGILANNTFRTEFIIENLKINLNILESCLEYNDVKIVNLEVAVSTP